MAGSMRECTLCRRLYSSSGGRVCQDCYKYLEEIYPTVRTFVRDSKNPKIEVGEIADTLEIPIKYVQGLVNCGYLNRDLPHAKSDDINYEDEEKSKLAKELQKATKAMKSGGNRKQTATTYGQERYSTGKK